MASVEQSSFIKPVAAARRERSLEAEPDMGRVWRYCGGPEALFSESPNRHQFDVIEDIRDKKGGLFEVLVMVRGAKARILLNLYALIPFFQHQLKSISVCHFQKIAQLHVCLFARANILDHCF